MPDKPAPAPQASGAPATPPRDRTLQVSELFRSIQGESTFAGLPCAFVRLTGCPLRCVWCDTAFAFEGGEAKTIGAILDEVAKLGVGLVEVTGGEPLAQPDCLALLTELCDTGYEVLLETSGAVDIAPVDIRVIKIVDIKCPGSGEMKKNRLENLETLGRRDELKFVLADRADYEWARDFIRERDLEARRTLLFSPVHAALDPSTLADWILADALDARLQIQLHKLLWPGRSREV